VKPTVIERRQLLQGGLGAFLSLINNASVADVLLPDIATIIDGDGLLGAQLRLGELLIRYLAGGKDGAAKQNTGNVVVSPASLAAVLSFVDLGGSNKMHAAIHRALGFKTTAQRTKDLAGLRTSVSGLIRQGSKDGPLVLANLIVFDRVVKPKQLALLGLSRASADMLVDNLADARVIDRINGWVKQKTYELIPEIIGEALETLGLLGLNALYFKDKWQTPFEPSRTKGEQFQTFSGKPADVQMMHSKLAKFRFRQDDRFIAAELGYASENFRLVVITTKSTPARPQEFAAAAGWLDGKGFEAQNGEIALPKLSLSSSGEMLQPLDAFGLKAARGSADALEGFSDEPLQIARILQKLELRVNEEGTEGAAATAVLTTRGLHTGDHIQMVVDKPFVFALRDEKTGLVLFMGYVGSPPAQA